MDYCDKKNHCVIFYTWVEDKISEENLSVKIKSVINEYKVIEESQCVFFEVNACFLSKFSKR